MPKSGYPLDEKVDYQAAYTTRPAIETELDNAQEEHGVLNMVSIYPKLQLRADLARFALYNDLKSEREALAVVAARYFAAERAKPKCSCEPERW
jgi:hypothetical protein